MQYRAVIHFVILISFTKSYLGLEYNKQYRYNQNTDFLQHEGGNYQNYGPKKDSAISQTVSSQTQQNNNGGKRDYVAQFPPLRPPSTPKSPTSGTTATTGSTVNQNSGKRDYVAPQLPGHTTSKPSTIALSTHSTHNPSPSTTTGSKRDYVAPQFPTLKPASSASQPSGNKVKDLVNFYDNKNTGNNLPQKTPSYSTILQGNTNKNTHGSTSTLITSTTPLSTKPSLSFSNVVSGNKSPTPPNTPTATSKPTTRIPMHTPTSRPGSTVLPSSILNNNKNKQSSSGNPTDSELQTLSEELLRKDVNNAAKYITVNYQERTTGQSTEDKAPGPLLTVTPEVWNIPTIQAFLPLLDNYERDTLINEYVTPQERNEENVFMDAIMSTTVIRHLMNFLKNKGYVTADPRQQRDFLKQLWFGLYSRGKGKISSSGFEHIFVSELKNGQVSGLHNWIYFNKEETANRINYLGYLKYVQINDKGVVMKLHFNQQGVDKPVDSMFIGTSPELEIALYTLCFLTRVDTECKLKLANKDMEIITHKFRYRSKDFIGSAYPQIPVNF